MMKSYNEDQFVGTKLEIRLKSLKRVEGCCQTLELYLQNTKLETIMNLMKFSVGSTIPISPMYGHENFTETNGDLPLLQLTLKLKELLQKRYLEFHSFEQYFLCL